MDAREKQIAAPKSWETFEDLCLALFKAIWNDPLAQKNGRRGQRQHGVDVFGSADGSGPAFFGVQCKGKDQGLGAQATVRELEEELARAEAWKPPLAHWTFATTAPTDAVLQEAARQLSAKRTAKGLFPVSVLGWGDIQALLVEHRSALRQFYPEVESDLPSLIAELRGFAGERSWPPCDGTLPTWPHDRSSPHRRRPPGCR
ncbi:restriction endonuclease [Polaromonas sp. P2-4]|nr:restriction endonuclease [Polaromonas sp. P2-4]